MSQNQSPKFQSPKFSKLAAPLSLALALLLPVSALQAQTASAPALPSSPAKKELIAKILVLQQPAVEGIATMLAQQPAAQMMQSANLALQTRVPAEKRDAIAKDIQADVKKYVDEAVPLLRERAVKIAPSTIGVVLEEKFTEEELKQLVAIMESPVNRKYGQLNNELQKALGEKLVAETRGVIEPKVRVLEESIYKRFGEPVAGAASGAASGPKAKAPVAPKPAAK
jgi:uncharacterized protein